MLFNYCYYCEVLDEMTTAQASVSANHLETRRRRGGVGGEVSGDHFMISISIICDIVIMIVIVVIIY